MPAYFQFLRKKIYVGRFWVAPLAITLFSAFTSNAVNASQTSSSSAELMQVSSLDQHHKPADVPNHYVITPFGYFSPACIQHVHNGDQMLSDGKIQRMNGQLDPALVCAEDNFTPDGIRVHPDGRNLQGQLARSIKRPAAASNEKTLKPVAWDWIDSATYNSDKPIGRVIASWKVPSNPTKRSGQTIYFFPGLQGDTILQPVLGYRSNTNTWDLSSWNCCKEGTVTQSDSIPAKPGDQIVGDTYSTCPAGVACSKWNIDTKNATTGQSVRLTSVPYGGPTDVVGGALEVYNVDTCDEYPSSGKITFSNIAVYDRNFIRVNSPPWEDNPSGTSPQCNYALKATPTSVDIFY